MTTRRQALRWTAGGGAALAGAVFAQGLRSREASAQTPATSKAVGAWLLTFPDNGNGGPGNDDPNEHELLALTSDGIVFASNSPTSPPDPEGGPQERTYSSGGFGAWTTTSTGQIQLTFNSVDYDDQGHFVDLVKISAHATMDPSGDSFTAGYAVQVMDASGNVQFDSQGDIGTVLGTRISA